MCSYAKISKPDLIRKHYYFTSRQFQWICMIWFTSICIKKKLNLNINPQVKILLLFTHPQVVPNLYKFLSSVEHKEDILKSVGKQTVDGSHGLSL